ncbi:class III signal peptide-containing protein [Candidatus Micrarchaeota archaeon]|nr:class III signal peptide-containing protein [Candidatus Micrarchaeota archaeon]MBU2476186.1 class III signal peptide-containing protein [Candidatus Micrarchaeota archaeon]
MENKAQVSVEMIVLLAAIVAVALVLVSQLQKTGTKGAEVIDKKADKIFEEISDIK